jgi:hypothetical protein
MRKILMITLLHLIVFILIQLFSFVRVLKIFGYFLLTSKEEFSKQDIFWLASYYDGIISSSLFRNPSCLETALMLTFILNWRGIPTEFCLGVSQSDGNLTAHAWLTFRGEVLASLLQVDEFVKVFSSSKTSSVEVFRKF